jgi:hypothetical protein
VTDIATLAARVRVQRVVGLASAGVTLLEAARACAAAGFDPVGCAPELYTEFPVSAAEMANALATAWTGSLTSQSLTQALSGCVRADGSRAWSDAEVAAAVQLVFPVAAAAVRFQGNDGSYVGIPGSGNLSTPAALTVEVWARASSFNPGNWQSAVFSRHAEQCGWELRVGEAIPRMMVTVGGVHFYAQPANPGSSPRLQPGQWYHLAGTYDGQNIVMYVNGQPWFTQPLSGQVTEYGGQVAIARNANPAWNQRAFAGDVREVRLWSVARTQQQIAAAMNAPLAANEPGLASYWPLNEGSGTVATDRTGRGDNGTINGGTWITA